MGIFALVCGFLRSKVPLIVCRALMGAGKCLFHLKITKQMVTVLDVSIGGAMTIPSAMHILVHMYPDPHEQAVAITIFGGMGAIGIGDILNWSENCR